MGEGKNLVGVDIGANSIKVVQLKEARKRLQVVRYGFAELPPQTIIDSHIMSSSHVVEALLKIWTDGKITQIARLLLLSIRNDPEGIEGLQADEGIRAITSVFTPRPKK